MFRLQQQVPFRLMKYSTGTSPDSLPVLVEAVAVTEQFHEAVLMVFGTLLWWGTVHAGKPVADLASGSDFRKTYDHCRQTALALVAFRNRCDRRDIRAAWSSLARWTADCRNAIG